MNRVRPNYRSLRPRARARPRSVVVAKTKGLYFHPILERRVERAETSDQIDAAAPRQNGLLSSCLRVQAIRGAPPTSYRPFEVLQTPFRRQWRASPCTRIWKYKGSINPKMFSSKS